MFSGFLGFQGFEKPPKCYGLPYVQIPENHFLQFSLILAVLGISLILAFGFVFLYSRVFWGDFWDPLDFCVFWILGFPGF